MYFELNVIGSSNISRSVVSCPCKELLRFPLYLQRLRDSYIKGDCMAETSRYSQVLELLRAESEAIAKAASRLQPEELDRVLSILTNCKGKVILLGVGKTGIIA